jgi:L-seryl-tRNA(Ser) seleniumtransferase
MRMIALPIDSIAARAEALVSGLRSAGVACDTAGGASTVGGGSLPGATLPTRLVRIESASPDRLLAALRQGHTAVVARIVDDHTCLDLRTVGEDDDSLLVQAVIDAVGG